jgi:hypothetical protein
MRGLRLQVGLTEQQLNRLLPKIGFVLLKGLFSLELIVWTKRWKGPKTNRYFPAVAGVAE